MPRRIPKTLSNKLNDLDSHLFIIREHLGNLYESPSHLKVIAAELRALLCLSSGTEGLLWRLVDELEIDDKIFLHVPGDLIEDHHLARGLQFLIVPIKRGGKGDPKLPPFNCSFKELIKERQALVVGGKPVIHEYLIKAIAQQMGSAHEDDGLEPMLVDLKSRFINGAESFIPVLSTNSELALEIGERVLENAERKMGYRRHHHKHEYGNLSIVSSLRINKQVLGVLPLFSFRSYVSNHNITLSLTPSGVEFSVKNHNLEVATLLAKLPEEYSFGQHSVFVFSYCSRTKQARTIVDGVPSGVINFKDIGWLHVSDLILEKNDNRHPDVVETFYVLSYERLLSSEDSKSLSVLPPNGYGLWNHSEELERRGAFPD